MKHRTKAGTWVRSHYRATWTGQVIEDENDHGQVIVLVLFDRCGRPMHKPLKKRISMGWLTVVPNPQV